MEACAQSTRHQKLREPLESTSSPSLRQQHTDAMPSQRPVRDAPTSQHDDRHWDMMDLDTESAGRPDRYYSLEEAAAQAKAQMPIGARMGLTASLSRSSVASSASSSSYDLYGEDDEPSLSRSLESNRSAFPVTPARSEFGRRPPGAQNPCSSPIGGSEDAHWDSVSALNIKSTGPQDSPRAGLPSLLYRGQDASTVHQAVPARTSLGQSLGLSFKSRAPPSTCESPISESRRGSEDLLHSPQQQTFNIAPSNLAARRNLPPLAIRGNTKGSNAASTTMPHTPGGSVFTGARDGAANGGQTPVSPFIPPTPLVATCNGQSHPLSPPSSATYGGQKRGSMPNVFAPLMQSPLQRQGSLGPMSPLSREFAAVSVRGGPGGSQTSASSQDTLSSASTLLTTPEVSPLVTPKHLPEEDIEYDESLSRQSRASSPNRPKRSKDAPLPESTLGATRPKLLKSKSTNRVSPYPSRDGTLGSPKTPRKSESQLRMPSTAQLLTPPTMEKSLSAPAQAVPRTVSAKHLYNRQLHPRFAANYTIADELGSGGFGFVVSATRNVDLRPVAVKFIWKDKVPTHGWVRDPNLGVIPLEAFVLRVVDHPCVVKFIDLFDDEEFFYLVMEMHGTPWQAPEAAQPKADSTVATQPVREGSSSDAQTLQSPQVAVFAPDGTDATDALLSMPPSVPTMSPVASPDQSLGLTPPRPAPMERRTSHDLFECIEQHTRFSEEVAAWVFAQIVEAVYYLAKLGICHRDIKDENCVIDSDYNVKLIDFGSAVISDPRKPAPYFNRFFGTMTFASSEILKGQQYRAPHAEVWSLGVLLSILLSGESPFSTPEAAMTGRISSRIRQSWSPEALNLLSGCVQADPDKRATIAQVREHPWVRRAWESRGLRRPSPPRIFDGRH